MLSLLHGPTLTMYMTTGKTIALTRQTFVSKVMPLLFDTLFRFVIAFIPKSKCLMSWLQSLSAAILEPRRTAGHCFHFFLHLFAMKVIGLGCNDLSFLNDEF